MAQKPEGKFIEKVHRALPRSVFHQGMGLTATNGTPDVYYEGKRGQLWVEYKWFDEMPFKLNLVASRKLSKLQARWLNRCFDNNRNCAVIIGSPDTYVILDEPVWDDEIDTEVWAEPFDNVIRYIKETVL
jgi:hypothetical protein